VTEKAGRKRGKDIGSEVKNVCLFLCHLNLYYIKMSYIIIENKQYFTSIYPLPAKVVYKIYIKI
jgi:hypothetical protein